MNSDKNNQKLYKEPEDDRPIMADTLWGWSQME